jgi:hypothetical protein
MRVYYKFVTLEGIFLLLPKIEECIKINAAVQEAFGIVETSIALLLNQV